VNEVEARLIELTAGQHQVFSRAQARAAGLSSSALSRRVRAGRLVACGTTALRFAGVTLTYRGELMAGILDLGPDALVTGRAAAVLHGLDGFSEGLLEYLVPRDQRGRVTSGVVTSIRCINRSIARRSTGCPAPRAR
jgi:putative AbiEi antitoxin of type IV toxin-antitoxin system